GGINLVKTASKRPVRSEVPENSTWDLTDLFTKETDWMKEMDAIEQDLSQFEQFKGQLHNNAETLFDCLSTREKLAMRLVRVGTYASLRQAEDGTNPINQANSGLM